MVQSEIGHFTWPSRRVGRGLGKANSYWLPAEVALDDVRIETLDGNACEIQEIDRQETRAGTYHPRNRNMPFYCTRVHLLFDSGESTCPWGMPPTRSPGASGATTPIRTTIGMPRTSSTNDMLTGPALCRTMRTWPLDIASDGSFTLHRSSSRGARYMWTRYDHGLSSETAATCGWPTPPDQDETLVTSKGQPADYRLSVRHGPLEVAFRDPTRSLQRAVPQYDPAARIVPQPRTCYPGHRDPVAPRPRHSRHLDV